MKLQIIEKEIFTEKLPKRYHEDIAEIENTLVDTIKYMKSLSEKS